MGVYRHVILIQRSCPRWWASCQSAFPHPAADSGPTHFYIEEFFSVNKEQESGTKERPFRAPGRLSHGPTKGRKCRAVAPCPSPGPAHLAGLWGLCAKKCQAQVLNFLPFVRLRCDLEFTKTLLLPTIHTYILWKNSLSLSHPGSNGFLWKWLGGSRAEQWKVWGGFLS